MVGLHLVNGGETAQPRRVLDIIKPLLGLWGREYLPGDREWIFEVWCFPGQAAWSLGKMESFLPEG